MTVYVITKGCYSDYHICTVTLDKNKAEKLAKMYSDSYDNARVEEYETDTDVDDNMLEGRLPYLVTFNEDGKVWTHLIKCDYQYFGPKVRRKDKTIVVCLYAENAESAIKIAAEKRAQYLAEKEGIA